jgi:hypothetical protein
VTGSEKYSLAQPFYGPDSPSEFTHFSFSEAPWITKARIGAEGLLTICNANEVACLSAARAYSHAGTREVETTLRRYFFGMQGQAFDLIYVMTPPKK